jgi:hypothetical protein
MGIQKALMSHPECSLNSMNELTKINNWRRAGIDPSKIAPMIKSIPSFKLVI